MGRVVFKRRFLCAYQRRQFKRAGNGAEQWVWRFGLEGAGGKEVPIVAEAAEYFRPWRGLNGLSAGAGRRFTVITDADTGLLAPDARPPRALGRRQTFAEL